MATLNEVLKILGVSGDALPLQALARIKELIITGKTAKEIVEIVSKEFPSLKSKLGSKPKKSWPAM